MRKNRSIKCEEDNNLETEEDCRTVLKDAFLNGCFSLIIDFAELAYTIIETGRKTVRAVKKDIISVSRRFKRRRKL